MKPGRRRLLIPGLLITLLVVVAIAAAMRRADAGPTRLPPTPSKQVSVIADPRIAEASGMAISLRHPGIAYVINDSGSAPDIYAVDIATGRVVGVTRVDGVRWKDTEAMTLWADKLWVSDTGNNLDDRTDQALYALAEPGPGNHHATAVRYPITFQGKPVDVESLAIVPGRIDFYAKGWPESLAFQITKPLVRDKPNLALRTNRVAPAMISDATETADGKLILLRGAVAIEVRDARTWQLRYSDVAPNMKQGETIGVEASGRSYLLGSEGASSPLIRVAFNPNRVDPLAKPIDASAQYRSEHPLRYVFWAHQPLILRTGAIIAVVAVVGGFAWRRARRHRREADRRLADDTGENA